jgi:carbamoyltransferase
LVWDGGTPAVLYRFDVAARALRNLGTVLDVSGFIYPVFAASLEPFRRFWDAAIGLIEVDEEESIEHWEWVLSVPGKAMAYAGLGEVSEEAIRVFREHSSTGVGKPGPLAWTKICQKALAPLALSDASIMASFEMFLYQELERGLLQIVSRLPRAVPLCFGGGCALNILFNANLRASGQFDDVWVPPFPNDSGAAIGAACTEMVVRGDGHALDWDVYSGPGLRVVNTPEPGWSVKPADITEVAGLMALTQEPVIVLSGRAELGPRALGHRSIIAPATEAPMLARLNAMKRRETYRPVAPVCLSNRASEIFCPGGKDEFMLFSHKVRNDWKGKVPAIVHANGTARLQTVEVSDPVMGRLLQEYERITGIPLLCNTSANLLGSGFFPDATSAMKWGEANFVWADGRLFTSTRGRWLMDQRGQQRLPL